MKKKVIITGATGMVGKGVLLECLDNDEIAEVLHIGRNTTAIQHPKLKERIHADFTDFTDVSRELKGYDACFYCLGISAAGLSEEAYKKISYDYTMALDKTLLALNPETTFNYVSGMPTPQKRAG